MHTLLKRSGLAGFDALPGRQEVPVAQALVRAVRVVRVIFFSYEKSTNWGSFFCQRTSSLKKGFGTRTTRTDPCATRVSAKCLPGRPMGQPGRVLAPRPPSGARQLAGLDLA
jgi:hypothetical protein